MERVEMVVGSVGSDSDGVVVELRSEQGRVCGVTIDLEDWAPLAGDVVKVDVDSDDYPMYVFSEGAQVWPEYVSADELAAERRFKRGNLSPKFQHDPSVTEHGETAPF